MIYLSFFKQVWIGALLTKAYRAVKSSFFPWRHSDRRKPKRYNAEGTEEAVSLMGIHSTASGFTRIGGGGEGRKVRYMAGINFQGGHCQVRSSREEKGISGKLQKPGTNMASWQMQRTR